MNEISVFNNEAFGEIRSISINGEPWFVASDICRALGLERTQTRRLDDDEKGVRQMHTPGGRQNVTIVNEPGLYALVMGSSKPEAKSFKRWITHDVIPSIRSHGGYLTPAMAEQVLTDPDTIIRLATELKQERALRVGLEQQARLNAPLVAFANTVTESENDISVGDMAKLICQSGARMGRTRLFKALRRDGMCMKDGTGARNHPTQRAIDMGVLRLIEYSYWSRGKVYTNTQTRVTGKGQLYFMELYGKK